MSILRGLVGPVPTGNDRNFLAPEPGSRRRSTTRSATRVARFSLDRTAAPQANHSNRAGHGYRHRHGRCPWRNCAGAFGIGAFSDGAFSGLVLIATWLLLATSASATTVNLGVAADRGGRDIDIDGIYTIVDPEDALTLRAGFDAAPLQEFRFALEFDLGAIPSDITITSASLSIGSNGSPAPGSVEIYGYSGNGVIEVADMTGGSLASGPFVPVIFANTRDVTSFLQGLVNGGAGFAGFRVQYASQVLDSNVQIYSSEFTLAEQRPVLTIEFTANSTFTVLDIAGGLLVGASGVDVGGEFYDVTFVDGTCIDSFAGCDEVTDFAFADLASATLASQALLDQVLLDGASGAFDSTPSLTAGCPGPTLCQIFTPAFEGLSPTAVTGYIAQNIAAGQTHPGGENALLSGLSIDLNPTGAFAKWAPHPAFTGAFSFPGALNTNSASDIAFDGGPRIVTDGAGLWLAAWESRNDIEDLAGVFSAGPDSDIFFARSTDAGATWTGPEWLNTNASFDAEDSNDGEVDLATDGAGNWVAVWESDENLNEAAGTDRDILVARSSDNGQTWEPPQLLNTNGNTDTGFDANPTVASDGAGHWIVAWESDENLGGTAGTDSDIFVARSSDNGANWTSPELLNSNGNTDGGGDGAVRIVSDQAGSWVAAWYSEENLDGTAGTDLDIFVARSTDNGLSWTAPALLNLDGSSDTAHDALPHLSTDAGHWVATWASAVTLLETQGGPVDVLVARSADGGATWTTPALLASNADANTALGEFMSVAPGGGGHWLAAWPSSQDLGGSAGIDLDIFVAASGDNGATWTTPALLNTNGEGDLGMDIAPQILTDGNGNWVAGWASTENLNGTAGTDADIFFATTDDIDGDGVNDFSDAFPLDPLEAFDTDGDGTGNNADLDDDGDGLPDTVETGTGVYVSPSNTGTFSLIADSDGDGLLDGVDLSPLDGADCRSANPQLRLVWGRDAPFGVDHQNDPGIGHRYVLDAAASLPGLASDDPRFPSSLPESLRSGLQALFDGARADYPSLPATNNGLQIGTVIAADPLPAQGTPGSPALLYIINRSALEDPVTDPDFGPLEGFAFSGVNRFNKRCTGEAGSVFIDAGTVPPLTDPGYDQYLADLVETVAHEAGHLYGLRHVLPDGLEACTGDPAVPGPTPAVMDYTPDGANTRLAHCTATPGQGCPVIEPPDCSGEDTGEDHNPLYHYLRYVVGDSAAELAGAGILPGTWDADSVPLVAWKIEFGFSLHFLQRSQPALLQLHPGRSPARRHRSCARGLQRNHARGDQRRSRRPARTDPPVDASARPVQRPQAAGLFRRTRRRATRIRRPWTSYSPLPSIPRPARTIR